MAHGNNNIDERLKFLLTSTESLHATCQELHAIAVEHSRQMMDLHARMIGAMRGFLESGLESGEGK